jgi:DNA-binding transcriptional regulator YdaS (Cro superfamily)
MTPSEAVSKAAKLVGSPAELARQLAVKPPTVHQWIDKTRPVPAKRAAEIEILTAGAVTRHQLCPDFPWSESPPQPA